MLDVIMLSFGEPEADDNFKILQERFPELEDIGWEAIDGYDWSVV
jgi:hypothetical protein